MSNTILEMRGIKKSFIVPKQKIEVLKGIDLSLNVGESLSIRGESGAGKTTMLNILTQLERTDSGQILWEGKDVTNKRNSWLAKTRGHFMGLVFQGYYLLPELSAFENVLLARRLLGHIRKTDRDRAAALLQRVGLSERMNHLPPQLSGGEAQRVAIARALMNEPKVIIADEPTGNLDEKTGEAVMDMLLGLCKEEDTALLLVTHNREFAKRTSRQGLLRLGEFQIEEKL